MLVKMEGGIEVIKKRLAKLAVRSLLEEAMLTPKPGLVDQRGSGTHTDMTLELMLQSAHSLQPTFEEIAKAAYLQEPSQNLREKLAEIGRRGEDIMFQITNGVNTHKGAIWALGLLVASASIHYPDATPQLLATTAGRIACFSDRWIPTSATNGMRVRKRYGVTGAGGEAQNGFPHVMNIALPTLYHFRTQGVTESVARVNALVSLIAHVDDTCILHRGGVEALKLAKNHATEVLEAAGLSTDKGKKTFQQLEVLLIEHNASPGGSADLLAAAIFLDSLGEKEGF